jgi:hypothetical protein
MIAISSILAPKPISPAIKPRRAIIYRPYLNALFICSIIINVKLKDE